MNSAALVSGDARIRTLRIVRLLAACVGVVVVATAFSQCSASSRSTGESSSSPLSQKVGVTSSALNTTGWNLLGPFGATQVGFTNPPQTYSGYVMDVGIDSNGRILAGAVGGLFAATSTNFPTWVPLTDSLTVHTVHRLWVKPNDPTTLLIGTGANDYWNQPYVLAPSSSGIYYQTAGGQWQQTLTLAQTGSTVWRIANDPTNPSLVYAATDLGLYSSSQSGAPNTWTLLWNVPNVTDVVVQSSGQMFATAMSLGAYYKSGSQMFPMGTPSNPSCSGSPSAPTLTNMGVTTLSVTAADLSTMYVLSQSSDCSGGTCLWKLNAQGWCNLTTAYTKPGTGCFGAGVQAQRNQALAVSPTDANRFFVGNVGLCLSPDGGQTFNNFSTTTQPPPGGIFVHTDQWIAKWSTDGKTAYVGTDGGLYFSQDSGKTFLGTMNTLPNTFGLGMDVTNQPPYTIFTANWDVGFQWGSNATTAWSAGGVVGTDSADIMADAVGDAGVWGSGSIPVSWWHSSNPNGNSWSPNVPGLNPAQNVYFAQDYDVPVRVFASGSNGVYQSSTPYTSFAQYPDSSPASTFPASAFYISATQNSVPGTKGNSVIYAPLNPQSAGAILRVYDPAMGSWQERSHGLSSVLRVSVPASGLAPVFAINPTASLANNQKVWVTNNNGTNWTALQSANLPTTVTVTDLAIHPLDPNTLYLATDQAVYRSQDQGATWADWTTNAGMPFGTYRNRLKIQSQPVTTNSPSQQVVVQTIGRGIWARPVDLVRRTPALACKSTIPGGASFVVNSVGQIANTSSQSITLACPLVGDSNFDGKSNVSFEFDGYAATNGGISVSHCVTPKAGGQASCKQGPATTAGLVHLTLSPATSSPGDYGYLLVALNGKSSSGSNMVFGYASRAGD